MIAAPEASQPSCRVCSQKFNSFYELKQHIRQENHHDASMSAGLPTQTNQSAPIQPVKTFAPQKSFGTSAGWGTSASGITGFGSGPVAASLSGPFSQEQTFSIPNQSSTSAPSKGPTTVMNTNLFPWQQGSSSLSGTTVKSQEPIKPTSSSFPSFGQSSSLGVFTSNKPAFDTGAPKSILSGKSTPFGSFAPHTAPPLPDSTVVNNRIANNAATDVPSRRDKHVNFQLSNNQINFLSPQKSETSFTTSFQPTANSKHIDTPLAASKPGPTTASTITEADKASTSNWTCQRCDITFKDSASHQAHLSRYYYLIIIHYVTTCTNYMPFYQF